MHVRFRGLVCLGAAALLTACKPNADAHFKKGNAYLAQSQFSDAVLEYRLALQQAPLRGDIREQLAEAYVRLGDVADARKEYVRAADLLPNDVQVQLKAGSLLLLAGSFEDAKGRASKALALDPKSADAQILLGNATAFLKDLDGAMADYLEAISLDPSKDSAYLSIGTLQQARGQRDQAEASFKKAIEVDPKSVTARMAYANFLWSTGRAPAAEQTLKDALAMDPNNVTANRALGLFYFASNRANEAEPYFKLIAKIANTDEAQLSLADYYVAARRPEDAKTILNELSKKPKAFAAATTRLAAIDAASRRPGAGRGPAPPVDRQVPHQRHAAAPARAPARHRRQAGRRPQGSPDRRQGPVGCDLGGWSLHDHWRGLRRSRSGRGRHPGLRGSAQAAVAARRGRDRAGRVAPGGRLARQGDVLREAGADDQPRQSVGPDDCRADAPGAARPGAGQGRTGVPRQGLPELANRPEPRGRAAARQS
jgi:tetratricopeptide (TPR) repeat protein